MTLTDTGPLIALIDDNDADHEICRLAIEELPPHPLATTWACFTEAMHLLRRTGGIEFQRQLWAMLFQTRVSLLELTDDDTQRMAELMVKYSDHPMDLADASLVAVAEARGYKQVFTLDGDFRIYRLKDGSVLEVAP